MSPEEKSAMLLAALADWADATKEMRQCPCEKCRVARAAIRQAKGEKGGEQ